MRSAFIAKTILVFGAALLTLMSCSNPMDEFKEQKHEFPNGRYSCTSETDTLMIEKSGRHFTAVYIGDPNEARITKNSSSIGFKDYKLEGDAIYISENFLIEPTLLMKGKMTGFSVVGETVYTTPTDSIDMDSFPIKKDEKGEYRLRKFKNYGPFEFEGYWLYCKKSNIP